MLGVTTMMFPTLTQESGGEVRTPTITRAHVGTWPVAYQPLGWGTTRVRANKTFGTFFVPRMLAAGSRTVAKIEIMLSMSTTMRGTMISMVPTMTSPPGVILRLEAKMREGSSCSLVI
jgi:hypothetical protein